MSASDVTLQSDNHDSTTARLPSGAAPGIQYALKLYRANSDLQALQKAYARYCKQEAALKERVHLASSIAKGFGTFNLAPSGRYDRYLVAFKKRSDYKAIKDDWKVVGELLACAKVKSLLESKNCDD